MIDIFNNPTFLGIVGIATPLICLALTLIFKKLKPSKDVKQWISWGIMVVIFLTAIFISGVFKEWTTFSAWIAGIIGYVIYYRLVVYEFMIKMLPEEWRKEITPIGKK